MSDSPTDTALTKGRERSAPGMSHADTHTPLHGPTGGVPSDKALSDTRGRSWTDLVQSPDVAAGASSCKGGSLARHSSATAFGTPSYPAPASLIGGIPPASPPSSPPEHPPAAPGPSGTAVAVSGSSAAIPLGQVLEGSRVITATTLSSADVSDSRGSLPCIVKPEPARSSRTAPSSPRGRFARWTKNSCQSLNPLGRDTARSRTPPSSFTMAGRFFSSSASQRRRVGGSHAALQ
mmetsp:Transcript_31519/g.100450  ORF Transcript_31519/g.100450 Transcript_31519/m.100450 type:complete len:235 (+) Transcript_31519:847-1551(+)